MPAQDAPSTTQKRMPPKGRPVEDSDLRLASDDLCSLYRAASVRPGLGLTSGIRQVNCAIRFRPITTDPDILRRSSGTCQGSNDLLADLADNTCRVPADSVSIAPRGHSRVWDTYTRSAAQPTPE